MSTFVVSQLEIAYLMEQAREVALRAADSPFKWHHDGEWRQLEGPESVRKMGQTLLDQNIHNVVEYLRQKGGFPGHS